jgi:hypothetical protein
MRIVDGIVRGLVPSLVVVDAYPGQAAADLGPRMA